MAVFIEHYNYTDSDKFLVKFSTYSYNRNKDRMQRLVSRYHHLFGNITYVYVY